MNWDIDRERREDPNICQKGGTRDENVDLPSLSLSIKNKRAYCGTVREAVGALRFLLQKIRRGDVVRRLECRSQL